MPAIFAFAPAGWPSDGLGQAVSPWWTPGVARSTGGRSCRPRGRSPAAFGAFFAGRALSRSRPPILQVSPGNETHLHALRTELAGPTAAAPAAILRTSPEFACKKLLAAGETRIFEFARVFRNREHGALHLPEFTMLEWYRAGAPYDAADGRLRGADRARPRRRPGIRTFPLPRPDADPVAEPDRLTVAEAFRALRRYRPAGDILAEARATAPARGGGSAATASGRR